MTRRGFAVALIGACLALAAAARAAGGAISVEDAWTRPTPGYATNAAVYFNVVNRGAEPDRLIAAGSSVAERAETHINLREGDIVRMRRVISIDIAPNGATAFAPTGFHVMLIGLKAPLKAGETFPLTLQFVNAGTITVDVAVKN